MIGVIVLELKYKRILLKLSGEALAGEKGMGIDFDVATKICESIKKCTELGVELAIVVGGGNFWRGRSSGSMDRSRADHMGMLATSINSLALALNCLISSSCPCTINWLAELIFTTIRFRLLISVFSTF